MHNNTQYTDILAYNESQRQKHKTILKLFTFTLILINIFELITILSIKHTKTSIQHENTHINQLLSSNINKQHNKTFFINKRLVNLHLRTPIKQLYLTDIFKSKNELDIIMNTINTKLNVSSSSISPLLKPKMCYQGKVDGDAPRKFNVNCVSSKMMVVIETTKGNRFGAFTANSTCGDVNRSYAFRKDENAFLFALRNNGSSSSSSNVMLFDIKYTYEHKAFKLVNNGFFIFGDKDLQIESYYKNGYSSYSLFPKCYGDNNIHKLYTYTNEGNEFTIKEMEIYSIL